MSNVPLLFVSNLVLVAGILEANFLDTLMRRIPDSYR